MSTATDHPIQASGFAHATPCLHVETPARRGLSELGLSLYLAATEFKKAPLTAAKLVLQHSPRLLFSPICFVQVDKLLRSLASLADEIKDDLAFLQSIKGHGKERSKGGKKVDLKEIPISFPFFRDHL